MNYNFTLAKSLGDLNLAYTKQQVIDLLGLPDEIEYFSDEPLPYDDQLENETLIYEKLRLTIRFCFNDDNEYIGIDVSTKCIIYNNLDWFLLSQKEIIDTIKAIYKQYKIKYKFEYEKIRYIKEAFTSEEYIFEELGITLFFDDGILNNVFIYKPENELILPEPKKITKAKPKPYNQIHSEIPLLIASEPKVDYQPNRK